MKRSRLSEIPGLGPKRIKELLAHFRSIDAIQLASVQSLAAAPGMGQGLAKVVWGYFHPESETDDEHSSSENVPRRHETEQPLELAG